MFIMTHEIKRQWRPLLIFALALSFVLAVVVVMYPSMAEDMGGLMSLVDGLGMFTDALNLDISQLNSLIGFYGMEMENMVGIAGALYAAYLGISLLSKEESRQTAEFLLSHPVKRQRIYLEKAAALIVLLTLFNIIIYIIAYLSIMASGQSVPLVAFSLLHGASLLLQLNIGLLCFGISAFLSNESIGLGMGIALLLYFFSLFANIWQELAWLRFITPFQYAFAADILKNEHLDLGLIVIVFGTCLIVTFAGLFHYSKRDIAS